MKHPTISSHYSNDDDRHYHFARRAEPPWYPERGLHPDGIVMIITIIIALGTLAGVWWMEGGL